MLAAATRHDITVELRRVPSRSFTSSTMIVRDAGSHALVLRAYACDGCGREESMLIDVDVHGPISSGWSHRR